MAGFDMMFTNFVVLSFKPIDFVQYSPKTEPLVKLKKTTNFKLVKTKKSRRKFTSVFKAKVAIAALKERETSTDLARKYELNPTMISKWKQEFIDLADKVFEKKPDNSRLLRLNDKMFFLIHSFFCQCSKMHRTVFQEVSTIFLVNTK